MESLTQLQIIKCLLPYVLWWLAAFEFGICALVSWLLDSSYARLGYSIEAEERKEFCFWYIVCLGGLIISCLVFYWL